MNRFCPGCGHESHPDKTCSVFDCVCEGRCCTDALDRLVRWQAQDKELHAALEIRDVYGGDQIMVTLCRKVDSVVEAVVTEHGIAAAADSVVGLAIRRWNSGDYDKT